MSAAWKMPLQISGVADHYDRVCEAESGRQEIIDPLGGLLGVGRALSLFSVPAPPCEGSQSSHGGVFVSARSLLPAHDPACRGKTDVGFISDGSPSRAFCNAVAALALSKAARISGSVHASITWSDMLEVLTTLGYAKSDASSASGEASARSLADKSNLGRGRCPR